MSIPVIQENWFEDWFDSPYYPMLYAHRSESEAEVLIDHIVRLMDITPGSRILDLACGRGRHSIALAKRGFDVTGVDLSECSIKDALLSATDSLQFHVHDMRRPVAVNYFDAVLNLFTSFGYFVSVRDNIKTIDAIHTDLKSHGTLVIDYFNAHKVMALVKTQPEGEKVVNNVRFQWKKRIENGAVIKEIVVNDNDKQYQFAERVQLFTLEEFTAMLSNQFEINGVYGDYELTPYDQEISDRLILRCRKK